MNKKKRGIFILILTIIFIIALYVIAYTAVALFTNQGKIVFSPQLLTNKIVLILWGLLSTALIIVSLCAYVKFTIIVPKGILTTNDRANSNLYDNQDFLSEKELKAKYGNIPFNELPMLDVHGYVLRSAFEKNKLGKEDFKISLIPDYHACLVGTTGTGKSTYVAGPTIQANAVSKIKSTMIINDISGELYALHSAQLKKQGYRIAVLNLSNPRKSLRYNPLSIVWDMYQEYKRKTTEGELDYDLFDKVSLYIADIADFMCINDNKNNNYSEWQQGAKGIVQAVIWALLEDSDIPELGMTKDKFTITQLSNVLNKQKKYLLNFLFNRNITSRTFDYAGNINDNSSEKTVDSYLSTLSTSLALFQETGIQYITSSTDIDISDLTSHPTAIFVNVPPASPSRQILATMLYLQIYKFLEEQAKGFPRQCLPRPVYYILDEFGNLPKLKDFPLWIATSRKHNVYFFIMLQSNKQLDEKYSKDSAKIILNNCQIQMMLGSSELDDTKRFKELFGTYTAFNRHQSFDTDRDRDGYKGNTSLVKKDLITSSDLQQIPEGTMYTYILREKPLKTTLVPTYAKKAEDFFLIGQEEASIKLHSFESLIYNLEERESIINAIIGIKNKKPSVKEKEEEELKKVAEPEPDVPVEIQKKSSKNITNDIKFIKR